MADRTPCWTDLASSGVGCSRNERRRVGARHEPYRKSRDHRVDPRFEHRDPETDADRDRQRMPPDRHVAERDQNAEQSDRDHECDH